MLEASYTYKNSNWFNDRKIKAKPAKTTTTNKAH
jgi:hypothetical protein